MGADTPIPLIQACQKRAKATITIITPSRNAGSVIADCVKSISSQTYPVEHVVIDGASSDQTVDIVRSLSPAARVISEPDSGIYDAMNKGIKLATGDIIGILNADDYFAHPQVIEKVVVRLRESRADILFADLVYFRPGDREKVVRFYSGAGFTPDKFAWGLMPPHPTYFVRRELYEQHGDFKTDYRIAADYELAIRFLARHRVRYVYLPEVIVRMRTGGVSTQGLKSTWVLNREIVRACAENGISTNLLRVYSKYFRKAGQLFRRPRQDQEMKS